jgi:hypothetical protein
MTIAAEVIERVRDVPIEDIIAGCGVRLRRVGRELVGPCPVCGGTDRFAIDPRRRIWNCRQCVKGGDVIALQQHIDQCSFGEAVRMLASADPTEPAHDRRTTGANLPDAQGDEEYARRQGRKAAWLWEHRQPITGSIGEIYLREARGYGGPLPPTLGFLPAREGRHPAMIAAFTLALETEPGIQAEPASVDAVHLTLLAADGRAKAEASPNRICVARPAARPIVIAAVNDLLGLAITEGIEDALSVAWALGTGAWAAGSAGFMPALADAVPSYIECVTIYAHEDPAGQRGARALADRLLVRSVEVYVEGLDG